MTTERRADDARPPRRGTHPDGEPSAGPDDRRRDGASPAAQCSETTSPSNDAEIRVGHNVDAVLALRVQEEERVGWHQRLVERVTQALGRPRTIYLTLAVVFGWSSFNLLAARLQVMVPDPPPFYWLQGAIGLAALLMTTMVLTTQNGEGRHAEQRSHLGLQVNLLAEQKVAKLIALIEELRRDLPSVHNRKDVVAEAMAEAFDPGAVISALKDTFEHTHAPARAERADPREAGGSEDTKDRGPDDPPRNGT